MCATWFDEDRQDESIIRICYFLDVYEHRFAKSAHLACSVGIETLQLLSFEFLTQLFCLSLYVCLCSILLFYGQGAHIKYLELLPALFNRLFFEVGDVDVFHDEVYKLHERFSFPIRCVGEEHGQMLIAHVVRVMLSDHLNYARFLTTFNIDVIVRILDADLLIPEN